MDADLIHAIGKYIWLPLVGALGWAMKSHSNRLDNIQKELNEVKIGYVTREELIRSMDGIDKKIDKLDAKMDKHDQKLDRVLEKK